MILRAPLTRRQLARNTWRIALSFAAAYRLSRAADQTQTPSDPWSSSELIQPGELAKLLKTADAKIRVICVAFPVLYRQRHIEGAIFAGPGGKPEGIESLRTALAGVDRSSNVVLYCGCCPMIKCPNIRPAYNTAKESRLKRVRVLDLADNFHADWVAKGYPVAS